jgi:RHS repeat-associated protein
LPRHNPRKYAQVVEEWNANGATPAALPDETLAVSYIYGDDLISQTTAAFGALPAQTSVYHYDGLGTTRALSNLSAAITDRYAYTAFGETDTAGTSGNNSGSTANNYLYTGEQKDPNLGLYYLRARYMNPGTGGFISQDSYFKPRSRLKSEPNHHFHLNQP